MQTLFFYIGNDEKKHYVELEDNATIADLENAIAEELRSQKVNFSRIYLSVAGYLINQTEDKYKPALINHITFRDVPLYVIPVYCEKELVGKTVAQKEQKFCWISKSSSPLSPIKPVTCEDFSQGIRAFNQQLKAPIDGFELSYMKMNKEPNEKRVASKQSPLLIKYSTFFGGNYFYFLVNEQKLVRLTNANEYDDFETLHYTNTKEPVFIYKTDNLFQILSKYYKIDHQNELHAVSDKEKIGYYKAGNNVFQVVSSDAGVVQSVIKQISRYLANQQDNTIYQYVNAEILSTFRVGTTTTTAMTTTTTTTTATTTTAATTTTMTTATTATSPVTSSMLPTSSYSSTSSANSLISGASGNLLSSQPQIFSAPLISSLSTTNTLSSQPEDAKKHQDVITYNAYFKPQKNVNWEEQKEQVLAALRNNKNNLDLSLVFIFTVLNTKLITNENHWNLIMYIMAKFLEDKKDPFLTYAFVSIFKDVIPSCSIENKECSNAEDITVYYHRKICRFLEVPFESGFRDDVQSARMQSFYTYVEKDLLALYQLPQTMWFSTIHTCFEQFNKLKQVSSVVPTSAPAPTMY